MARSLAFAYALSVLTLVAMVALGRGVFRELDGPTVFLFRSIIGLLLIPASIMFIVGGHRSSGSLRQVLAYCLSFPTAFLGFGSLVAVVLTLSGSVKPDA
jgi:hypothetical protein